MLIPSWRARSANSLSMVNVVRDEAIHICYQFSIASKATRRLVAKPLGGAKGPPRAIHRQDEKLALLILRRIADLRAGRVSGEALEPLAGTGDLSDCRKLYVGFEHGRPTHRIVYREHDDGVVEIIEVIAVGEREAFTVYLAALRRLGRSARGE